MNWKLDPQSNVLTTTLPAPIFVHIGTTHFQLYLQCNPMGALVIEPFIIPTKYRKWLKYKNNPKINKWKQMGFNHASNQFSNQLCIGILGTNPKENFKIGTWKKEYVLNENLGIPHISVAVWYELRRVAWRNQQTEKFKSIHKQRHLPSIVRTDFPPTFSPLGVEFPFFLSEITTKESHNFIFLRPAVGLVPMKHVWYTYPKK